MKYLILENVLVCFDTAETLINREQEVIGMLLQNSQRFKHSHRNLLSAVKY